MGYTAKTYINITNGALQPGREVLEAAAKLANVSFEDCIQFPDQTATTTKEDPALDTFRKALRATDWRRPAALQAEVDLLRMKRPRHPKYGGRQKKRS